jgi:WD40 repeat protein
MDSSPKTDVIHMEQTGTIKGHSGDVYALELTVDDGLAKHGNLVSAGDYTIKTWHTSSGIGPITMSGHTGYISCIKVRGKRLFSGSWDTTVRSWNLETGKAMHIFKGHKNIVNAVDVIDTDIFSGSWDMSIIQWSRGTGEMVNIFKGHTDGVQCLQYYNNFLYSGSMDKTIRVWDLKVLTTKDRQHIR